MSKCEKMNCGYYYKTEEDDFPCCHFEKILEGLKRSSENPDIINLVQKTQCYLDTLWEGIEDIE